MSEQEVQYFQLSNGIRLIHQQRTGYNISHCGLIIDAGSRDELSKEHGLAHFIEHAIFKGTKKRKTFHILNRLDSVGGDLNAYTTKEETSIYASFLTVHTERAIELIADIAFNATFPAKELKKEKDVIIDEIQSYLDSPSDTLFDEFEESIYKGHALGRSILGTEKSVSSFGAEEIFKFRKRRYQTSNIVFSYIGDLPFAKVKTLAEKHLCEYELSGNSKARIKSKNYHATSLTKTGDTHQAHIMIGGLAYDVHSPKKFPMMLLNNLLGGPAMNSLLNLNIRERHGIAYNIEANYQPYTDTGLFQIYLGTDKGAVDKAVKLVNRELKKMCTTRLGTRQLHSAKMQIKGYLAMSREGGSSNMLALGKSMLLYDKIKTTEEILKSFDDIDSSMVLEVANEVLSDRVLSTLIYS